MNDRAGGSARPTESTLPSAMDAVVISEFGAAPQVGRVAVPSCGPQDALIRVRATGLCRSDWHGWSGHDDGISPPYVPGHEFAGEVCAVGAEVGGWTIGDRVTAPFVCACGECPTCARGDHQVCPDQEQPGFTYDGSFAEYVLVKRADVNLVRVPEDVDFATAASLGCRFATSYRAVALQGRVRSGDTVVVHGCGGVGLSAVMIAVSLGARVIATDISDAALSRARELGAVDVLNATRMDTSAAIVELTRGGADVSIDALGNTNLIEASIKSLRPGGRHVQVGLVSTGTLGTEVLGTILAREISVIGSHGLAAADYPPMLDAITRGELRPDLLIREHIRLEESGAALMAMGTGVGLGGMTMIEM